MTEVKPKMSTFKKVVLWVLAIFFGVPLLLGILAAIVGGDKTPKTAQTPPQAETSTAVPDDAAQQAAAAKVAEEQKAAAAKAEQQQQDAAKWQEYKDKATALIRSKIPSGKPYGDYEVDWQNSSPSSIRLLLRFKDKAPKPEDARVAALYGLKLALQVLTEMGMTEKLDFAVARVNAPSGKGVTGKKLVATYNGKAVWDSRSDSLDWEDE